jgi:transposase InsO family protein
VETLRTTLPNECWQSDATHWRLADDTEVEIINVIDDHSRVCIASQAVPVTTAADLVQILRSAGEIWGFPASVLSDNGNAYTTWHRGGPNAFQRELLSRGICFINSRPYHPQTCGKVERFHQTLKLFLAKQDPPATITQLQTQLDRFVAYYNDVRSGLIAREDASPRAQPSTRATRHVRPVRRSRSARACGYDATGSTATARSHSATEHACTTSESARHTRASA